MNWIEARIDTCSGGLDDLCGRLEDMGIEGLVIDDEADFKDFLENNHQYWDYVDDDLLREKEVLCRVTFYLPDDGDGKKCLRSVEEMLSALPEARLTHAAVADADWENNWKQYYKPMEIGERLLVIPQWEEADCGSRVPLILDPGLTFGTGSHATTQLCLTALEKAVRGGEKVLDLGCGSGILSIAALALGAEAATGVDIDPKAEDMARENAAYNGFAAPRFRALTGNVTEDRALMEDLTGEHWQLVLVNIVADVIIGLCPVLPEFLKEDTTLILSGILDTRLEDVLSALKNAGIKVRQIRQKEDWRCVVAGK